MPALQPTFFLEVGSGDLLRYYVMRKKPPGKLLPSAHAIEREYRCDRVLALPSPLLIALFAPFALPYRSIMTALRSTTVPVPRTHALCNDR